MASETNPYDYYPTPQECADAVCAHIREKYGSFEVIVEPSAGSGSFVRAARKVWPEAVIIANEIQPDNVAHLVLAAKAPSDGGADDILCGDWLELAAEPEFRELLGERRVLILGNPPFSHAEEHVTAALPLLTAHPGSRLCYLLRGAFREGRERYDAIFVPHGPERIIDLVQRPSYTGGGKTDRASYSVFVWSADPHEEYVGSFFSWRAKRVRRTGREGAQKGATP